MFTTEYNPTANKILDASELLAQKYGLKALTYGQVEKNSGLSVATIKYYFASKNDLAHALILRYHENFSKHLRALSQQNSAGFDKLKTFAELFLALAENEQRFCLCGMLSAELCHYTPEVKSALKDYFAMCESWIRKTIRQGMKDGSVILVSDINSAAAHFLATLEGGMLITRADSGGVDHFKLVIHQALFTFKPAS